MSAFASDLAIWQMAALTAVSFAVGILGGFVGLALGTIRLPAMLLMGMPPAIAGGTNILVSSLASLTGAIRHLREGRVDRRLVLAMGIPAFAGALLGGFASDAISDRLLLSAAGILVFWQGVEFIILARNRRRGDSHMFGGDLEGARGDFTPARVSMEAGIGFGVGVLGGAVGLILGSIRLPAMIRVLRIDPRIAAGSNLFIGFFMGALGWVGHAAIGRVDYTLLAMMAAAAMLGSYLGARLTGKVELNTLILVMGATLLAVGALLTWRGIAGTENENTDSPAPPRLSEFGVADADAYDAGLSPDLADGGFRIDANLADVGFRIGASVSAVAPNLGYRLINLDSHGDPKPQSAKREGDYEWQIRAPDRAIHRPLLVTLDFQDRVGYANHTRNPPIPQRFAAVHKALPMSAPAKAAAKPAATLPATFSAARPISPPSADCTPASMSVENVV